MSLQAACAMCSRMFYRHHLKSEKHTPCRAGARVYCTPECRHAHSLQLDREAREGPLHRLNTEYGDGFLRGMFNDDSRAVQYSRDQFYWGLVRGRASRHLPEGDAT